MAESKALSLRSSALLGFFWIILWVSPLWGAAPYPTAPFVTLPGGGGAVVRVDVNDARLINALDGVRNQAGNMTEALNYFVERYPWFQREVEAAVAQAAKVNANWNHTNRLVVEALGRLDDRQLFLSGFCLAFGVAVGVALVYVVVKAGNYFLPMLWDSCKRRFNRVSRRSCDDSAHLVVDYRTDDEQARAEQQLGPILHDKDVCLEIPSDTTATAEEAAGAVQPWRGGMGLQRKESSFGSAGHLGRPRSRSHSRVWSADMDSSHRVRHNRSMSSIGRSEPSSPSPDDMV